MKLRTLLPFVVVLAACSSGTGPKDDTYVTTDYTIAFMSTVTHAGTTCTRAYNEVGTANITYNVTNGEIGGDFLIPIDIRTNISASAGCAIDDVAIFSWSGSVTGSNNTLAFESSNVVNGLSEKVSFVGTLSGGVVKGTLRFTESGHDASGDAHEGTGSAQLTFHARDATTTGM